MFSKIGCWNKFHLRNKLLKQTSIWWTSRNPFQKTHISQSFLKHCFVVNLPVLLEGLHPRSYHACCFFLEPTQTSCQACGPFENLSPKYWWTKSCWPMVEMVTTVGVFLPSTCFSYSSKWVGSVSPSFWGESSNTCLKPPLAGSYPITRPKTNKSSLKKLPGPKKQQDLVSLCHHSSQPFALKIRGPSGLSDPNYLVGFLQHQRHRSQESPPFSSSSCVEKMVVKAAEQVGSVLFRWRASCARQRILVRYMTYA